MSVLAGGTTLNPTSLRSLLTLGGDTGASMEVGSENNPAVRGAHLLVKYAAPLNKYYEQWHGRELHALKNYAATRQLNQGRYNIAVPALTYSEFSSVSSRAWAGVPQALQEHRSTVGLPNGLSDSPRVTQHARALADVVTHEAARTQASQRWFVEYDDNRSLRTKVINVYAATGQTSMDAIGAAMNLSGDTVQLKEANRQYMQQLARFDADKAAYQAEQDAKRRSAQGSLLGMVVGGVGSFFK